MNSYERYLGVLKGTPVDFLPRTPILMQYAAEHIGADYAGFAADHQILVKANLTCAKEFGFDQISCISDPYRETQGFGASIKYIKNGPPISTHPLKENKRLASLKKPDPLAPGRMLDRIKAIQVYKKQCAQAYSILGWIEGPAAEAADLRDVTEFLMDLAMDEPFACDLMDVCVETGIDFARAQVEAGADTIGIGDAIASQVSPDMYERLIQPRERRLIRAVKEMGAFVKLHICGNITHLLPGIADLDIDILDVDHMVEMRTVRDTIGNDVALAGNIDPVSGVLQGTPDLIRGKVLETYEIVGNPFIVNAGCEIPSR
ncbi:MAG: uroporphyrinogen decarboxylase family protein, partial [Desulfobacterales bacterium]